MQKVWILFKFGYLKKSKRLDFLRHTNATLALVNGDDLKTVQANLGHATAAFTLQRYVHASEAMKRASANRMQQFFDDNVKKA